MCEGVHGTHRAKQSRQKRKERTYTGLMWGKEMYERTAWPTATRTQRVTGVRRYLVPTSERGDCVPFHLMAQGATPTRTPSSRGWWGPWVGAVGVRFLPNSPRLDGPNTGYRRDGAWLHVWGYLTLLLDLSSNCEVAWTGKPNETNTHRVCATRFSGSDLAFLARCAWACGIHSGVTVVFV